MTRSEITELNKAAESGMIKDEVNPAFIFGMASTELLSKIAKGDIICQESAKRELENRGLDLNGRWVGFTSEIK